MQEKFSINSIGCLLFWTNKNTDEVVIYDYMDSGVTTNQDIILMLSKRVKEYRLVARLSQKEMAEKSGVGLAGVGDEAARRIAGEVNCRIEGVKA